MIDKNKINKTIEDYNGVREMMNTFNRVKNGKLTINFEKEYNEEYSVAYYLTDPKFKKYASLFFMGEEKLNMSEIKIFLKHYFKLFDFQMILDTEINKECSIISGNEESNYIEFVSFGILEISKLRWMYDTFVYEDTQKVLKR